MSKESLTDTGADQTSSDSQDESLLEDQQQQSADEEQQDTVSSDDQSQDSESDSSTGKQTDEKSEDDDSSDDDGLKKFAKSQGFDPDNLTDNERKALKIAHDNQKAYRKKAEESRTGSMDDAANDVFAEGDDEIRQEINVIKAQSDLDRYYRKNPDAIRLEDAMRDVVQSELEAGRADSAKFFLQNLDVLYRETRYRQGEDSVEAARETGRRDERELLRKRQEGAADNSHAVQTSTSASKLDRDWIENVYDPSNPEHVKQLDEAMSRGDFY